MKFLFNFYKKFNLGLCGLDLKTHDVIVITYLNIHIYIFNTFLNNKIFYS